MKVGTGLRPAAAGACVVLALAAASPCVAAPRVPPRGHAAGHSAPRAPGYLGIGFRNLSPEQAAELHLKPDTAVEVVMVDHDGPAGQAGLRPHDIIVAMNGRMVRGVTSFSQWIHQAGAGSAATFEVLRDGSRLVLHTRLANRQQVAREAMQRLAEADPVDGPGDTLVAGATIEPGPPQELSRTQAFLNAMLHTGPFTGVMMEPMTPQLAGFFGAPGGTGLLVSTVVPNSPADTAGLQAGDVVLRADGVDLHAVGDWMRHLRETRGRPVLIVVLRDHRERNMTLIPDLKRRSALRLPKVDGGSASALTA